MNICILDLGSMRAILGLWKEAEAIQSARVEIIESSKGGRLTPACVSWTIDPSKRREIGKTAMNLKGKNQALTMSSVIRLLDI